MKKMHLYALGLLFILTLALAGCGAPAPYSVLNDDKGELVSTSTAAVASTTPVTTQAQATPTTEDKKQLPPTFPPKAETVQPLESIQTSKLGFYKNKLPYCPPNSRYFDYKNYLSVTDNNKLDGVTKLQATPVIRSVENMYGNLQEVTIDVTVPSASKIIKQFFSTAYASYPEEATQFSLGIVKDGKLISSAAVSDADAKAIVSAATEKKMLSLRLYFVDVPANAVGAPAEWSRACGIEVVK